MKITAVDAYPIRLPRDSEKITGTAGSPSSLAASDFDYRWSETVPALYSVNFETALVKVTTDSGLEGWGEAQAPLAPEVACTIVERLLRPVLVGQEINGSPDQVKQLWNSMYRTMRVRGQTGGFMLDAISGVDLALWDLTGKIAQKPVAELIAPGTFRKRLPAYLSGLSGTDNQARLKQAETFWNQGFRTFKLFFDRTEDDLFDLIDRLRERFGSEIRIAVDALWRLDEGSVDSFAKAVDRRDILWLECPLPPEDAKAHGNLAARIKTPLALGESYRTRHELRPFFEAHSFHWLQPDLGRCGISEAIEWARLAADSAIEVVPHVSIAMGPQIAAALHLAAAIPNCPLVEYNPRVFEVANRYLREPLVLEGANYLVPRNPGLGIAMNRASEFEQESAPPIARRTTRE